MPVSNEKFDQLKIDKLKHFLEDMAAKGNPRPYEIFVDNLKVVPKTDDPKDFENYEYYMNENTEKLRILIYNSAASPRNDQYCFMVQHHSASHTVNGLGELDTLIQEKITAREREIEMNQLRNEIENLHKQLEEAEEYAESLESQLEVQKKSKFKLGNINMGEFASVMLEGVIRRNPQLLAKIPGGEALAGVIEQDNLEKENKQLPDEKETQASFQKKSNPAVSEEHQRYIIFLQHMESVLDTQQMQTAIQILDHLVHHPEKIKEVAALLLK
ncbi:MAG TPA: hypothetical protein PKA77_14155 [Chitinophagaceae bacterium]|jgi:hypothetical protein|nr:hypothetical protein [Chitinophagaceae bacterium]HMU58633.1 hypothetical protein [Chitinophagaceae bacterium]